MSCKSTGRRHRWTDIPFTLLDSIRRFRSINWFGCNSVDMYSRILGWVRWWYSTIFFVIGRDSTPRRRSCGGIVDHWSFHSDGRWCGSLLTGFVEARNSNAENTKTQIRSSCTVHTSLTYVSYIQEHLSSRLGALNSLYQAWVTWVILIFRFDDLTLTWRVLSCHSVLLFQTIRWIISLRCCNKKLFL